MIDLDEFRLIRPLGRGGMGMVYLAHDTVLDREVAIKLIGSTDPDATSRDRFLNEARAVARLSHPNVVSIYRVGTTNDGRPYLVQELIGGTSLDKLARPVAWRRAAELALGVTRGVAAAHRRGILHRDIKPGNVMLDDKGEVRILDFGLAKLSGPASPRHPHRAAVVRAPGAELDPDVTRDPGDLAIEATLDASSGAEMAPGGNTVAGALLGTPRYLAPELWQGELASVRSDLYAIGVLLHELVTGEPPFPGRDIEALERAVTTTDARPVADVTAGVPAWFSELIDRCLARDPARRWESADELAYAIEQGLTGGPPVPAGNPYRGLGSFDAAHRGVFFGRGADVGAVIDRLRRDPMIVVAGDSGIGKSSVCHAGVVPAVLAGALDDRRWRLASTVPGRRPFAALCDSLELAEELRDRSGAELVRLLRPAADGGVLVVIDQLEELVTLAEREEADRATELIGALADGIPGVRVLLAVRGDFLTRVAALPALAAPFTRGLHLLRALGEGDLREAVLGPARIKGVTFESDAMVDALVGAVRDNPGALPLLQFALAELWDARDPSERIIRASALEQLGGVAGALARHADRVVLGLTASERAAARRILLRLVAPTGTRVAREAGELVDGPSAGAALEALVRGRLVVARDTTTTPIYELAHEALIASWSTLRDWLDDQAGHRAITERVAAAAAAWRRDGRRRDLLWSRRQLRAVEPVTDLGEGAREFLEASRRQLRRTRGLAAVIVAAVPIVALTTWLIVRAEAQATQDREIGRRRASAAALRVDGDRASEIAAAERAAAFTAFDRGDDDEGEAAWARARTATGSARAAYRAAAAELEMALALDANRTEVRDEMGGLLAAHAVLAEAARDADGVADLVRRLEAYDRARAAMWRAPAQLELRAAPGVAIAVRPVADVRGRAVAGPPRASGTGFVEVELPAGSYLLELTAPDGHLVRAPVLLGRGERRVLALDIPPAAAIPAGYIYIPPGELLIGSDHDDFMRRDFLKAVPMHTARTEAYLIARHEVTYAEWIAFLDELAPAERARRRPATRGGSVMTGELERDGDAWAISLQPGAVAYRARRGEPLRYRDRDRRATVAWERLPVAGVDLLDARAYAAWLDASGRVPGARLCSAREWERAARGADGRPFPHGSVVEPDDANLDFTYGRKSYGPDEVGSHPRSDSPFGVADMLGNVWEWVESERGAEPQTRGGGWYQGPSSGLSANRDLTEPGMREVTTGVRICARAGVAR